MQKSKFTGAEGGTLLYPTAGLLPAAQILLIGLGGGAEITGDTWRKAGARARKEAAAHRRRRDRGLFFARQRFGKAARRAGRRRATGRLPIQ